MWIDSSSTCSAILLGTYFWNDDVVLVVLSLLQKRVTVTEETGRCLVAALQKNAQCLNKSAKFAKLVLELFKYSAYKEIVS